MKCVSDETDAMIKKYIFSSWSDCMEEKRREEEMMNFILYIIFGSSNNHWQ